MIYLYSVLHTKIKFLIPKHKLLKVVDNWFDMFSFERKLTDNQMECMQFGICDYAPREVEEFPFFHY